MAAANRCLDEALERDPGSAAARRAGIQSLAAARHIDAPSSSSSAICRRRVARWKCCLPRECSCSHRAARLTNSRD